MKNALKCVFELLDFLENWENRTTFSEKAEYWKKYLLSLFWPLPISEEASKNSENFPDF